MKLYGKLALFAGVPFGVLAGAFAWFAYGLRAGLVTAVVGGFSFGLLMSAVLGSLHAAALRRVGGQPGDGPAVTRAMDVATPFDAVFLKCVHALQAEQARIQLQDIASGRIEASTPMSWRSWGENICVELSRVRADCTRVKLTSTPRLKTTLVDYGKGVQNVERISRLLVA